MESDKVKSTSKPPHSLVSVIIAAKNAEKFVQTALESVVAQIYAPLEIIVVDGNSIDDTVRIVSRFEAARIIVQSGRGIGNAYNNGVAAARGEFVAFLSADDLWARDKIELQTRALLENPAAGFAVCRAEFFLENPAYVPPGFRIELLRAPRVAFIMETLCCRRAIFETVGFFDEKLRTSEDVDWFARARDLSVESIAVQKVLLKKRIHDQNLHLESAQNNRDLLRAVKNSINRKRLAANRSPK